MNTSTHSLTLSAPKQRTFDFLSRIDNLPKWATLFCRELKREPGGKHKVVTPQGEIFFRIVADPETGVIDMYGGPSEVAMAHWPSRVIGLDDRSSLFLFTALQDESRSIFSNAQQNGPARCGSSRSLGRKQCWSFYFADMRLC